MASDEDAGLFMPDEYDAEIERLQSEKKEFKEPKAKRRRQVRRAQIIGRGFVRGRYLLDKGSSRGALMRSPARTKAGGSERSS